MKKRASPPSSLPSPSMVDSSASSPSSSSSSSSSSYSSCVVDFDDHNNNHNRQNGDEMKPPKPKRARRKRVSINTNDKPKAEAEAEANANANANAIAPINRRSSIYRGVTRHRWTGRFEAHLWDKSSWNSLHNKKGRQVYLGAYDSEVDAARTYDLAALKYWGPDATLNFPIENYSKELEEMENVTRVAYLSKLRRRSNGFSRGVSKYRGVARHHHNGRWEARIGRVLGNKYLYLGTFGSQEEAAAAYDLAAIEYRGPNAVTNFDISNYIGRVKSLMPKDQSQPPSPSETKPEQQQQEPQIKQQKEEEQQHEHKQELEQQCLQEAKQREQMAVSSELEESKLISSIDHSSLLEMDPVDDHRENPWSFCLDSGVYDPHLVPDIPLEEDGKLLDMFDQVGFEDNIDLIFEGEGKSVTKGDLGCQTEIKASMDLDKKMENALSFSLSSPSSPASTSSLVSC